MLRVSKRSPPFTTFLKQTRFAEGDGLGVLGEKITPVRSVEVRLNGINRLEVQPNLLSSVTSLMFVLNPPPTNIPQSKILKEKNQKYCLYLILSFNPFKRYTILFFLLL